MALFSGRDDTNLDVIATNTLLNAIKKMLSDMLGPRIGELKFSCSNAYTVNGDTYSAKNLPANFNGWVYANGKYIVKADFPEMTRFLLEHNYYPGFKDVGNRIALPSITRFIRMNPNVNKTSPMKYQSLEYSMPNHIHDLGGTRVDTTTTVIPRGAWIWETKGCGSVGKHSATTWNDKAGHSYDVPEAPAAHCGNSSTCTYAEWDIPIDSRINTDDVIFKCNTNYNENISKLAYPAHYRIPFAIYIGRIN